MRDDLTVIYFTSNREKERFEKRIQETLLSTINGLPLISVSHKPMDFGKNICVGIREATTQNAIRQIEIGAMKVKTDFVCLTESDFIYPKEYFEFKPVEENTAYIASPIYVLFAQSGKAKAFVLKKGNCNSAIVVGRNCLINAIDKGLKNYDEWGDAKINFDVVLNSIKHQTFITKVPLISFKTDENMHRKTPFIRGSYCRYLEGIGTSNELIKRYMS